MINWFSKAIWLVFMSVFIIGGCKPLPAPVNREQDPATSRGKQPRNKELLAPHPDLEFEIATAMPDYASESIEAAGGLKVWSKVEKLERKCVVTFYQTDGSFYLTSQHHVILPWLNSIRISAHEPQGKFIWQFSGDTFSVLQGVQQVDTLPITMRQRYFAEAILNITTAPIRFLDSTVKFVKAPKPVKIEGLWYYPIERVTFVSEKMPDIQPYWSKVVFYQNRDSLLVDMLWFADADQGRFLMVRGYDYHQLEETGIYIPTKIEIFETDARGVLQQRLIEIDY